MVNQRQYIWISGADPNKKFKIGYTDNQIGKKIMLFVHGFAASASTWEWMRGFLPEDCRAICIDLKCCGYSEKSDRDNLTPYEQSAILKNFILAMGFLRFTLIGHSMGGAISLLALFEREIRDRVERLILLDSGGVFQETPDFIKEIALYNDDNPLIRFVSEDIFAYIFLCRAFNDEKKITSVISGSYAEIMKLDGAKEALIASARQLIMPPRSEVIAKLRKLAIPSLIIWGSEDHIIDIADGYTLSSNIPNSTFKIIQNCGHSPQEEMPEYTGSLICDFMAKSAEELPENKSKVEHVAEDLPQLRQQSRLRPHLTKMVDRWSFGTLIILLFMKAIQLLRFFGLKANENGWRKATGVFLKKEQSKFMLGSFNLQYFPKNQHAPDNLSDAKMIFINRISEFLRRKTNLHWAIEPGFFSLGRKKANFTDVIEVNFDSNGEITKLNAFFDPSRNNFPNISEKHKNLLFKEFINNYNKLVRKKSRSISAKLERHLKTWLLQSIRLGFTARFDMIEMIDRLMTATFINFEVLPEAPEEKIKRRFATPNIKIHRHPGYGLMNMMVRFAADFSEADLWVQYHHVPVDGMPMQELMADLKEKWGAVNKLGYPALNTVKPEIFYSGNRVFRARMFVDFTSFLEFRRQINLKYRSQMNGPATIASMIMWGLCQHKFFSDSKILFPVDIEKGVRYANERELSLIFIRPATYFDKNDPLNGFLRYQREFNLRLSRTRTGRSESYEMLELYSMVHPIFYYMAKNLMPGALSEYVGTVGLSIMRNAEMFIAPLSDLQSNGFMAIGNMRVPTADGKEAGAISICGSRRQVGAYIEAMNQVVENFAGFVQKKS